MDTQPPPEIVRCPICDRPLTRAADGWLAIFECDRCGQFTDFASADGVHGLDRSSMNRARDLRRALGLRD